MLPSDVLLTFHAEFQVLRQRLLEVELSMLQQHHNSAIPAVSIVSDPRVQAAAARVRASECERR